MITRLMLTFLCLISLALSTRIHFSFAVTDEPVVKSCPGVWGYRAGAGIANMRAPECVFVFVCVCVSPHLPCLTTCQSHFLKHVRYNPFIAAREIAGASRQARPEEGWRGRVFKKRDFKYPSLCVQVWLPPQYTCTRVVFGTKLNRPFWPRCLLALLERG